MTVDRIAADAFGAMAEDYERGRPGRPADAVAALLSRFGARTVLDLAAGTGKLTEVLERHGIDETTIGLRALITTAERIDG